MAKKLVRISGGTGAACTPGAAWATLEGAKIESAKTAATSVRIPGNEQNLRQKLEPKPL
jgi:hypothetical protein